jgi:type II secretory pathway pseudopilin PulG
MLRKWSARLKKRSARQSGFTLVETLVGMALLVIIGVALLASLTLSARVLAETDNKETARDLAVAEMEYIRSLPYAGTYTQDASLIPSGSNYEVNIAAPEAMESDGNLQLIKVTVLRNGHEITRLEGYKVKWQ